jgi:tRNA(Ile)-lysidine synthase
MVNRLLAFNAERLLDILKSQPPASTYLVGFSGGADSTALLYALKQLEGRLETPIRAIHINHGIHADADQWQEHCVSFCQQHEVALDCRKVQLAGDTGKGVEAEARHLRYQAMSSLLEPGDQLLTAHHADDQAETLLLNLMRGSGVDGLSAMPQSRPLEPGVLLRPLLDFENSALISYLQENDIAWLEDPSNQLVNQDRNFIRHEILPLLEDRWQGVNKRLLLTRNAMAEARSLLERLADEYLAQYQRHPKVLQVAAAQLEHDPALFKLAIRRWMKQSGTPPIPVRSLESLYEQVFESVDGHKVQIQWGGCRLRLYQQQLWFQRGDEVAPSPDIDWSDDQTCIELGNDIGKLSLEGLNIYGPPAGFRVSNRQTCPEHTIKQGGHHKRLKKLFQSAGIPGWLRDSIPLCLLDGELVAVGDWCFDDQFATWMSENGIKLTWKPENALLQFVLRNYMVDPDDTVR